MMPICPECMSYLLTHPKLFEWLKCPACGFTIKKSVLVEKFQKSQNIVDSDYDEEQDPKKKRE